MSSAPLNKISDQKSTTSNSLVQRIITFILALILLVLLTVLALKLWTKAHPLTPQFSSNPTSPQAAFDENFGGRAVDLGQLLTDPKKAVQSLPLGARPLDHEPANLPVPPNSEVLLRYQVGDTPGGRGGGEQVCVRTIHDTTIESATSFYRQALTDAGEKFEEQIPAPQVLRLTAERKGQRLMIRLRQAGSEVRLVLWLRYTKRTDS